jgi:hypothetical protein
MPLKVVFFYNATNEGWTETYYALGSDPQTYALQYLTQSRLQKFVNPRESNVTFFEARVSLIGSPRVTYSLVQNQLPQPLVASEFAPDVTAEDALILMRSLVGPPRHLWLRGLPESSVVYDTLGNPTPPAVLLAQIQAMATAMSAMNFCIQNATIPLPNANNWYQVTAMQPSLTNGSATVLTIAPQWAPSPPYPPIYFQGLNKNLTPGFPRQLIPLSVLLSGTVTEVTVPWLFRAPNNPFLPMKMKFTPLAYTTPTIQSVSFERYGTRKTGRPFGVPRGRSVVAVKRQ